MSFFKRFLFFPMVFLMLATLSAQQGAAVNNRNNLPTYALGAQRIGPDFGNNPASENFYNQMRDEFAELGIDQKINLSDIQGSIYLDEKFQLGPIYFKGKEDVKMYMRYNAFNDEVEIRKSNLPEDQVLALFKNTAISCDVGKYKFQYISFVDEKGVKKSGYIYKVYNTDNYVLYGQKKKLFKEGKIAKTSHATSFPHRFIEETNYYLSKDGGEPVAVPNRKKDLIALFSDEHQDAVSKFLKKKKFDYGNRTDLINVLAFANTL